ncbi:MAG: hypothetical protein ACLTWL_15930 [Eubacterium callanderi]|nr:hypothetical protein [Eubacterium callanderi]
MALKGCPVTGTSFFVQQKHHVIKKLFNTQKRGYNEEKEEK